MVDSILRRLVRLNDGRVSKDADYVLYWMQHAQRASANPALERAAWWANECRLPLLVLFVVDPDYPEANARHYTFMLEGIAEARNEITKRGAHFTLRLGTPPEVATTLSRRAAVVVTDHGYLRHLRQWRDALARDASCLVEQVEGEVIVPVAEASPKAEIGARTIRPKLHRAARAFLDLPPTVALKRTAKGLASDADQSLDDVPAFVARLGCDTSVPPVDHTIGGTSKARERLRAFVAGDLARYGEGRADIVDRHISFLSPYLHFGQLSPLELYHAVQSAPVSDASKEKYVDEMFVRRELAVNYVHYVADYDAYAGLPGWAKETLAVHAKDKREAIYSRDALEAGKTNDPYWNAAMREMRITGYLHNHLRMYWGKRILGWMQDPQEAYAATLYLNNKYFLDGRDANSYTNVSWVYGLHDRGWTENPVYGKVRIMKPSGLKRKFDIDAYVRWADSL